MECQKPDRKGGRNAKTKPLVSRSLLMDKCSRSRPVHSLEKTSSLFFVPGRRGFRANALRPAPVFRISIY